MHKCTLKATAVHRVIAKYIKQHVRMILKTLQHCSGALFCESKKLKHVGKWQKYQNKN